MSPQDCNGQSQFRPKGVRPTGRTRALCFLESRRQQCNNHYETLSLIIFLEQYPCFYSSVEWPVRHHRLYTRKGTTVICCTVPPHCLIAATLLSSYRGHVGFELMVTRLVGTRRSILVTCINLGLVRPVTAYRCFSVRLNRPAYQQQSSIVTPSTIVDIM